MSRRYSHCSNSRELSRSGNPAGVAPRYADRVTRFVRLPALISATLAPIVFIGGTITAELLSPQFDPVVQTISELAAGDAPTQVFMTAIFVLTALCHATTAVFATGIGRPGRVVLAIAAAASLGVAAFPLPTMAGSSAEHRVAAIIGFIALAVWPVFGMRRGRQFPFLIRPLGAILGTLAMASFCFWFLGVWSQPELGYVGVVERLAANIESIWPALVVWSLFAAQRRAARDGTPPPRRRPSQSRRPPRSP
jgi:hypothetical membrane protein